MNKAGKWAEDNLVKSLTGLDEVIVVRWPDYASFIKVKCPICSNYFNSRYQAPKAPADFIMLHVDKYMFIEVKSCKNAPSYVFRDNKNEYIRPHQMEFGKYISDLGGKYYFVIYRDKNEIMVYDAYTLDEVLDIGRADKKTRISWDVMREHALFHLDIGKRPKVFNAKEFMENIK